MTIVKKAMVKFCTQHLSCSDDVRVAGEPDSVGERADTAEGEDDGDLARRGVQQGRGGHGTGKGIMGEGVAQ